MSKSRVTMIGGIPTLLHFNMISDGWSVCCPKLLIDWSIQEKEFLR